MQAAPYVEDSLGDSQKPPRPLKALRRKKETLTTGMPQVWEGSQ